MLVISLSYMHTIQFIKHIFSVFDQLKTRYTLRRSNIQN